MVYSYLKLVPTKDHLKNPRLADKPLLWQFQ